MGKKCTICNAQAKLQIKDTSDYYCDDCAKENFGDITMLVKIEQESQRLKRFLEEKIDSEQE